PSGTRPEIRRSAVGIVVALRSGLRDEVIGFFCCRALGGGKGEGGAVSGGVGALGAGAGGASKMLNNGICGFISSSRFVMSTHRYLE
ncbi:MAG TPA: hypothetical protein VIU41_07475, partial [Geobacteraceae bacterium]